MKIIKFVVKVSRGDISVPQFVRRIDRTPIEMTTDRKRALIMGRLTAEDVVKSIQTIRAQPGVSVRHNKIALLLGTAYLRRGMAEIAGIANS